MAAASVYTDQPDYTPGSVVTISGDNDSSGAPGYVEGNTVDVVVSGPNGWTSSCSATVAAGGSWSCTVTLDSNPAVAVGSYSYTATSTDAHGNPISESGTFTDAQSTTTTVTSSLSPSFFGQSVTFTATVKRNDTNAAHTAGDVKFGTGTNCTGGFTQLQAAQAVNGSGQVTYTTSALAAGTTTIRACYLGSGSGSTAFAASDGTVAQVVNETTFTFSLAALPAKSFGDSPFSVASYATTNSTGAVTFSLAAASTGCTVDSAGMVTITGVAVGTDKCKISASLAASSPYIAKGPITQEFSLAKATPTFDFDLSALPAKTFGDSPFSVASYVTKNSPGAVTFALASGSSSCTVNSAGTTVTITGAAGQCKIDATLAATANYLGASDTDAFNIAKATPTFDFDLSALPAKTFGDSPFSVASYVTKNSPGAVTFALAAASTGCTVDSAGTVTITGAAVGADKCKIAATLAATANYLGASDTDEFNIAPGDTTAPTGSISINGGDSYTKTTAVTLHLAATDAVGVTAYRAANGSDCSGASWVSIPSTTTYSDDVAFTLTSTDGPRTVCVQYKDAVPNTSTNFTDTIVLDRLAPAIVDAGFVSGTSGTNGWYTSDVVNGFTVSDGTSGLNAACQADFPSGSRNVTISSEGTSVKASSGPCTDLAGNTNSGIDSDPYKLDKTGPSAALAVSAGTVGLNGWYTSDVTVHASGTDLISDSVTCTADQFLTTETTGDVFNGSCTNGAGLSTNAAPLTVKLDKTDPTLTWSSLVPADGGIYYFGFVPAAPTCAAADALSGPGICTVTGYGTSLGSHTMTAKAYDVAGNSHSETRTFTVLAWTLKGFFQPVDMNGVWNTVKNGSTVPLKFQIFAGSTQLTDTAYVKSVAYVMTTCITAGTEDAIEEIITTGGTVLRYDASGGQFIDNWKTPSMAGKCYRVTMTTQDGSAISALFKLK